MERTVPMVFTAYALVVLWYLHNGTPKADVARAKKDAPWYRQKKNPSFMDMIAALRAEIWASRFSANPVLKGVRRNIRELLPGWLLVG